MNSKPGVQRIETDEVVTDESDEPQLSNGELSLEELSAAYSKLIRDPMSNAAEPNPTSVESTDDALNQEASSSSLDSDRADGDAHAVTVRGIIEAILFVGNSENSAITATSMSGMMRGVQPTEVIEWINELNQCYLEQGHVIRIVEDGQGYRMRIAQEHVSICDSMLGKLREVQLNQAAVDCLSLVAYRPGITREALERLWNRPASSVLGLLVRRELLRIEREGKGKQASIKYFPTDRFLNLIGIASLDDLPQGESELE